ncbi:hypothetical protein D3C87_1548820 [compost metagenome]
MLGVARDRVLAHLIGEQVRGIGEVDAQLPELGLLLARAALGVEGAADEEGPPSQQHTEQEERHSRNEIKGGLLDGHFTTLPVCKRW